MCGKLFLHLFTSLRCFCVWTFFSNHRSNVSPCMGILYIGYSKLGILYRNASCLATYHSDGIWCSIDVAGTLFICACLFHFRWLPMNFDKVFLIRQIIQSKIDSWRKHKSLFIDNAMVWLGFYFKQPNWPSKSCLVFSFCMLVSRPPRGVEWLRVGARPPVRVTGL